jgi:hypothetical protein
LLRRCAPRNDEFWNLLELDFITLRSNSPAGDIAAGAVSHLLTASMEMMRRL